MSFIIVNASAEAERSKTSRPYDEVPELPDSLEDAMAALLVTAATLERSYQEVLDADKSPGRRLQVNELNKLSPYVGRRPGAFHIWFEEIGRSDEGRRHLR